MRVYTIGDTLVRENFPHDNYYKMTLVWLNHNIKYMSECDITIYYTFEENNALFTDHFQNFIKNFDNVTLKKLGPAYGFPIPNPTLCMLPYVRAPGCPVLFVLRYHHHPWRCPQQMQFDMRCKWAR